MSALRRAAAAALVAMATVPTLSSCSASTAGHEHREHPLCSLLSTDVLAEAHFAHPVHHIANHGTPPPGLSQCRYSDEPAADIPGADDLILMAATPEFLRLRHLSARTVAALDEDCVPGSSRTVGAGHGLGTFATWCIGKPGSTRGSWVQHGTVYSLSYASASDNGDSASRLDRFAAIARLIAKNVDA